MMLITSAPLLLAKLSARSDLPNSAANITSVNPTDWLHECVVPYKFFGFPENNRIDQWSNYWQIAMPHGLCADALACAFEECTWTANATLKLNTTDLTIATFADVAPSLPPLNLPDHIAFPRSVAEVVDVVKYAAGKGQGISVKSSGHSYSPLRQAAT